MKNSFDVKNRLEEATSEFDSFADLGEKTGIGRRALMKELQKDPMMRRRIARGFTKPEELVEFPDGELIVLDSSVIRASNIIDALNQEIAKGKKIVITSSIVQELDYKQGLVKRHIESQHMAGINAKKILIKAVKEENAFALVDIPEFEVNPDDDLINAIRNSNQKNSITLWTGDKALLLKARMYGIKNRFIEDVIFDMPRAEEIQKHVEKKPNNVSKSNMTKMFGVRLEDGKLRNFGHVNPRTTFIQITDMDGKEKDFSEPLNLGDVRTIIRINNNLNGISLRKERVAEISDGLNAERFFFKMIFNRSEIDCLNAKTAELVKRFMREFNYRFPN